jgi:hypothetical protein
LQENANRNKGKHLQAESGCATLCKARATGTTEAACKRRVVVILFESCSKAAVEPPGGQVACPKREMGSWFVGSGEARRPCTPVGNPTENKPLHDPGDLSPVSPSGSGEFLPVIFDILRCATLLSRAKRLCQSIENSATRNDRQQRVWTASNEEKD